MSENVNHPPGIGRDVTNKGESIIFEANKRLPVFDESIIHPIDFF